MSDAQWQRIRDDIHRKIARHGQCVQVVYLTKDDPPGVHQPFMYTLGNHERGLPELLIVGTTEKVFVDVLNRLGKIQRDRSEALTDGEIVSVGGKYPLRVVDAGEVGRTQYATFVGIYYETDIYEVRQVLLPDTQGRWPDTPGCDAPYRDQPILSAIRRSKH
jgi:hypothetical protein